MKVLTCNRWFVYAALLCTVALLTACQPIQQQNGTMTKFDEKQVGFLLACRCTPDQLPMEQPTSVHNEGAISVAHLEMEPLYLNEERVSFLLACRCTPDKLPK